MVGVLWSCPRGFRHGRPADDAVFSACFARFRLGQTFDEVRRGLLPLTPKGIVYIHLKMDSGKSTYRHPPMRLHRCAPPEPGADPSLRKGDARVRRAGHPVHIAGDAGSNRPHFTTRLADFQGLERTTLTRNLGVLVRDGFVRIDEGEDRRVRKVAITPAGEEAARLAFPFWKKAQDAALAANPAMGSA